MAVKAFELGWVACVFARNGPSGARDFNFLIGGVPSVPEPGSLVVLGLGVMGVITRRRRR